MKIISLTYKEKPYYLTPWAERSGHPSGTILHNFRFKYDNGQKTYPVESLTTIDNINYAILINKSRVRINQSEFDFMKDNNIKTL